MTRKFADFLFDADVAITSTFNARANITIEQLTEDIK